jgi:hypothetical protein
MNQPNHTPVQPESIVVRDNDVPPAVGRIVHYVLSESDSPVAVGEIRPAVIVAVEHGQATLAVFTRGGRDQMQSVHHVTSAAHVEPDGVAVPNGSWHWPPPRELVFKNVPMVAFPPSEELPTEASPPDSEPYAVGKPPAAFVKVPNATPTADELPSSHQDPLPFPESKP